MSNKSEVMMIAEAILANARVLEMLVAKLPDTTKQAVAEVVNKPTPVAPAPQAPAPEPVITVSTMPAAPFPTPAAPAAAPTAPAAPAAVSPSKAPFTDQRGLVTYTMGKYKALGQEKGARIQDVLKSLGISNINEVPVEKYQAFYDAVEQLG